MREWMLKTSTAAVIATATVAVPAFGQAQERERGRDGGQQQLDQLRQREKSEEDAQGDRRVEVREKALWALGDLPPKLMHRAMEKMAQEPDEARKAVMQSANILELQSALSQGQGRGGDRLTAEAESLRELARRIEYKEVLSRDELKEPFSRAAMAAASFYQEAAQAGLQRQDEEQTGYTLKAASEYFTAAHAFGEKQPTGEVSRAIFDADRLSSQIVKLSKPTTYQSEQRGDGATARREGEGDLRDNARTAGARAGEGAGSIPQEADRVISTLGDAIRQAGGTAAEPAGAQNRSPAAEDLGSERISRPTPGESR